MSTLQRPKANTVWKIISGLSADSLEIYKSICKRNTDFLNCKTGGASCTNSYHSAVSTWRV